MTSITSRYLEAALIDQIVAGQFANKKYAFVATVAFGHYGLGVSVANEEGFSPIAGKEFTSYDEAKQWASELNAHIGREPREAMDIIGSSMFPRKEQRR